MNNGANGITRRTPTSRGGIPEFGLVTSRIPGFGSFGGLLQDVFNDPFFQVVEAQPASGVLPLDVSEDDSSLIVRASLPGFSKDQITAEVNDGVLTIVGTVQDETSDEKTISTERYFRRERRIGTVSRSVSLPEGINADEVKAELKDGVLTLRLAKTPKAQPRKINIG